MILNIEYMEKIIPISIDTTFGTVSIKGKMYNNSEMVFNLGKTKTYLYFGYIYIPKIKELRIIPNMYYGDKILINRNLEFKLEVSTWNSINSGLVLEKEKD